MARQLTPSELRLIEAGERILGEEDSRPGFLHSALCQLALPRSARAEARFERSAGNGTILVEAGSVFDGTQMVPVDLPYGVHPRLALVHVCAEAVRTQNPVIDVSRGITPFLRDMGISVNGKNFRMFKKQMGALAACHMTIGFRDIDGLPRTIKTTPIKSFCLWADPLSEQRGLWPDELVLDSVFYESLLEHAVPLDHRAVAELSHSALALDCYAWLAHRLFRTRKPVTISWKSLQQQFGHEYRRQQSFVRSFKVALNKSLTVYPSARVDSVDGGIRLYPSPAPIRKSVVVML